MTTFFGFNPPFFGGAQNVLSKQTDERLIKNDLLQLLLTAPGERVFRPDFGTNIRTSIFEQLTDSDIDSLRSNIADQIERFERRISLREVTIETSPEANSISIKIFGALDIDRFNRLPVTTREEDIDLLFELQLDTQSGSILSVA